MMHPQTPTLAARFPSAEMSRCGQTIKGTILVEGCYVTFPDESISSHPGNDNDRLKKLSLRI